MHIRGTYIERIPKFSEKLSDSASAEYARKISGHTFSRNRKMPLKDIMPHSTVPLDGILGWIMAGHIAVSGAVSLWDNLALLLGEGMSQETEIELRKVFSECSEIESVEGITVHDYGPDKKVAVAEVNFVESCGKDAKSRVVDNVIRFCRDTMCIELSLYGSLY